MMEAYYNKTAEIFLAKSKFVENRQNPKKTAFIRKRQKSGDTTTALQVFVNFRVLHTRYEFI